METIMVVVRDIVEDRIHYDTFDDAYEYVHYYCTKRKGGFYTEEEWEEDFNYNKVKAEFEKNEGYFEFFVELALCTKQYYVDNIL